MRFGRRLRTWYLFVVTIPLGGLLVWASLRTDVTFGLVLAPCLVLLVVVEWRKENAGERLAEYKMSERSRAQVMPAAPRSRKQVVGAQCAQCGKRIVTLFESECCVRCSAALHVDCRLDHVCDGVPLKE